VGIAAMQTRFTAAMEPPGGGHGFGSELPEPISSRQGSGTKSGRLPIGVTVAG
jgi:hypothetical protein